jgi:fructuronate reductase
VSPAVPALSRDALGLGAPPPVRVVHLGLGAFSRSHQAWYTAHADDADAWGIAAFSGRSADLPTRLERQQSLYTLVERGSEGDRFEHIGSIARSHPGSAVDTLLVDLARPEVSVVTLTVTEAAYPLGSDGRLDVDDPLLRTDAALLRSDREAPLTPVGRLVAGLERRRTAGHGPLALVSCDNLPGNGALLRDAVLAIAGDVSGELERWTTESVAFVSTSVDRITPAASADLAAEVRAATGFADEAPVVTEPFRSWVLSGEFPAGRPAWQSAGAEFVDDIERFEHRKLWLLNGAHTLLAASGILRGHRTVAQAIDDPEILSRVRALWDEAERHLEGVETTRYRSALESRFANRRIEHRLEQIAIDAETKVRLRIVPVARRERRAGRPATASAAAIGAWIATADPAAASGALARLDPELAADTAFADSVATASRTFTT